MTDLERLAKIENLLIDEEFWCSLEIRPSLAWLITSLRKSMEREKILREALGFIHERINCTEFPNLKGSSEECKALSDCSHMAETALALTDDLK